MSISKTNLHRFIYISLIIATWSCQSDSANTPTIQGLWKVEKIIIDGLDQTSPDMYINLANDSLFMALEKGERLAGTWAFSNNNLDVVCDGETICNGPWKLTTTLETIQNDTLQQQVATRMYWEGQLFNTRTTKISFQRIKEIPSVQDSLSQQLYGQWGFKEVHKGNDVQNVQGQELHFLPSHQFQMWENGEVLVNGQVVFDEWKAQVQLEGQGTFHVKLFQNTLRLQMVDKDREFVLKRI